MTRSGEADWATITPAQRAAARWAGAILLTAMATSMVAELVLLRGVASGDGAAMLRNALAREAAYRAGAVVHILTFASDAAVAAAFFVVLAPVNRGLATVGALWRAMDGAVLAIGATAPFAILRLAAAVGSDDGALAALMRGAQGDLTRLGWVLLGLGSGAFALILLKSRYVPRILPLWGLLASLAMAAGPVANMLQPGTVPMAAYMGPMFFYEVPLGLWLLLRGISAPRG